MNNPKPGEYWYIEHEVEYFPSFKQLLKQDKTYLCKILAVNDDYVFYKIKNGETLTAKKDFIGAKWNPSLFFRLLGYI